MQPVIAVVPFVDIAPPRAIPDLKGTPLPLNVQFEAVKVPVVKIAPPWRSAPPVTTFVLNEQFVSVAAVPLE